MMTLSERTKARPSSKGQLVVKPQVIPQDTPFPLGVFRKHPAKLVVRTSSSQNFGGLQSDAAEWVHRAFIPSTALLIRLLTEP